MRPRSQGWLGRAFPLVEFAYNTSYQANIQMAPYEALYGRPCDTPIPEGSFFFLTTVRSLSRQRNIYHDRILLSCAPSLGSPALSCAPDLVCYARMGFSVAIQHSATLLRQSVSVLRAQPGYDVVPYPTVTT